MKYFFTRVFGGVKGLLFLIALGIGLFLHLYTQKIIGHLRDESRSLVTFYAQMYARIAETESQGDLSFIFNEIILRTDFPLIYTDPDKNPLDWKGISIDPGDRSVESLDRLKQMVERMDREVESVPVRYEDTLLGYLYYGDSQLIQEILWLPYIEVGVIGLFILLGFVGYANIKRSEQRYIWVGMAKETAHQLGTPISSIMGWIEVMRSGKHSSKVVVVDEIERDIQRLNQVTQRFSEIGSKPDLKKTDAAEMLHEAVEYIQRRAPQLGRSVEIIERYEEMTAIPVNPDLFKWALENILKNSLDAMDKTEGRIEVRLRLDTKSSKPIIEIKDNGKGIDKSDRKRIFKPGYSTKRRGWGLGLSLAKRIIEEYHKGKLYVKEGKTGEGNVMRIELRR